MLSHELMGAALLGLSWVTAVMVALDAWIDGRALVGRLARWRSSLVTGEIQVAELGSHEVEQRVKLLDGDAPGLVFFDRVHRSVVHGGAVRVGADVVDVAGAPAAEVWIADAVRAEAAACGDARQFDAVAQSAQAAGGGLRTVRSVLRAGQPVWLEGARDGARFTATLVAGFDPRQFARARLLTVLGVIALDLTWVSLGTALALWPPVFGAVSTVGAVVLIGHFLGMTPLAIAARERCRTPAVAFLRGAWRRPTLDTVGSPAEHLGRTAR